MNGFTAPFAFRFALAAGVLLASAARCAPAGPDEQGPTRYEGLRALVVEPENRWDGDAAVYGALAKRGFEVTYAPAGKLPPLAGFDIVATDTRRSFSPGEVERLTAFVTNGGALYGSWGGPFATPDLLKLCRVRGTESTHLRDMSVIPGTPLATGFENDSLVEFSGQAGHAKAPPEGREIVLVDPDPDAVSVAKTMSGRSVGVVARWGEGRTAILGFVPEQAKHFADPGAGDRFLDNLLGWLLEARLSNTMTGCTGRVGIALPAGTTVKSVTVGGDPVAHALSPAGTVSRLHVDLGRVRDGTTGIVEARVEIPAGRHVETIIHLPWNTLVSASVSAAGLAEYMKWLGATICQPLLRGSDGTVWYKGLPGDTPNPALVKKYKGDFLKDLVRECHARGIKVIGGVYLDDAVVQRDPLRGRVGRDGKSVLDRYGRMLACFNHPDNQADNLAMFRRLVKDYDLDGLFLDDNFELDQNECFGAYCVGQFKKYCVKHDVAFADPAREEAGPVRDAWVDCRRQATRGLVALMATAPRTKKLPLGGWTGATPRAELAGVLDLTGCMVYEAPASSVRLPVAAYGDSTKVVCLLWEPDTPPAALTAEGREAIRAGAPVVGFWIRGADGGYRIDDDRAAAIRAILYHAEEEWVRNYRETLITGDPRFEVVEGTVARDRISLTVRNAGARVRIRTPGPVDLGGVLIPTTTP